MTAKSITRRSPAVAEIADHTAYDVRYSYSANLADWDLSGF